jgi:glycogen(starch) synthase
MFRAGDPYALAAAVVDVLEQPEVSALMRVNARRFVESERSWAASVGRYAGVYSSVINNPQFELAH